MKYSYKIMLLFVVTFFFFQISFSQKQTFSYNDNWGKDGFNLTTSKSSNVEVTYSIKEFSLVSNDFKGETLQNIELNGIFLFNDAGMPDLPGSGRFIAIPQGSKPVLEIVDARVEVIKNVEMAPAPIIPLDTEYDMVYEKNQKVYSKNEFYPANPIKISNVSQIRGVDVVTLGITPFQYNPVTNELRIYRDIKVNIRFEGGNGIFGNESLRNKWWDPILAQNILNYNSLPKIDYSKRLKKAKVEGEAEYVIITLNNPTYLQWADSIKNFRRKQGILTEVYTITEVGGNTVNAIDAWVTNAYNNWETKPVAVLLMADFSTSASGITSISYPHPYSGDYISDNTYADVTGDDLPDIVFARMTANNATELQTMVTKFINYETNPPTSVDFYNKPITALGWQTERWFQICSEVVGGFWRSQGKNPVRINAVYEGNPASDPWSTATNTSTVLNFFGPSGLNYLPASPTTLGGWTGGTATQINTAINSGAFMLQHRDHGLEEGWGEPVYRNNNIDGLTNTDLSYIWSINCLTGRFDYNSEVFAEKFHRHTSGGQNSGCVGIMAASQVSYSFVNDVFVWGAFDNMYPEFMPTYGTEFPNNYILPAFAAAAGKHFLYSSSWPYNTSDKQITYRLFHQHGDAFLNIYSEVPQNLSVDCPDVFIFGNNTFEITVDEGADVAVTYFNENTNEIEILGLAQSNGIANVELTNIPDPGNYILVTITKQNFYRYTKYVQVITPEGPFMTKKQIAINDANWNNNGLADYEEMFFIDLTLQNVGSETANNVTATLTTTDAYVVSLEFNENISFGNIEADQMQTSFESFRVKLANDVPDQYKVNFQLVITDASKATYESNIMLNVNSPILNLNYDEIIDEEGLSFNSNPTLSIYENEEYLYNISVIEFIGNQNGVLDPNESANIFVDFGNIGHSDLRDAICWIETTSPYITILSDTIDLGLIEINQYLSASFLVTVSEDAPIGSMAEITFHFVGGAYVFEKTQNFKIGQVIEDFESGTLTEFNWTLSGNPAWFASTDEPYEGNYSAQSGAISDDESNSMSIDLNGVTAGQTLSFYYKVSSESGWDFLTFYVNGTMIQKWSGTADWALYTHTFATANNYTIKFEYSKDGSLSSGSDCGWIDYVDFPVPPSKVVNSKEDITISALEIPEWLTFNQTANTTATLTGTAPEGENNYEVSLSASNTMIEVIQDFEISVEEYISTFETDKEISIYPIPTTTVLNISFSEVASDNQIKIINNSGQVVFDKKSDKLLYQIDLTGFSAGVYFIEITNNNQITKEKIIIK